MSLQQIENHFQDKSHQQQTICCTIKELLMNNIQNKTGPPLKNDIVMFLGQILQLFDDSKEGSIIMDQQYNMIPLKQTYINPVYSGHLEPEHSTRTLKRPKSSSFAGGNRIPPRAGASKINYILNKSSGNASRQSVRAGSRNSFRERVQHSSNNSLYINSSRHIGQMKNQRLK